MKLVQLLKTIWKQETKFPTATKHITKFAFEVGGVKYYEFDTSIGHLPYKRGLKFSAVYNELDMKVDKFYLSKHVEAMEKILNGGKRIGFEELVKIDTLNKQIKERMTWVHQEDLMYKIASVVFFDVNENPNDWEWGYALKKIEHWKKHSPVGDFFLCEPIQRLIPFLNTANISLESYFHTQKEIDKAQLENLLLIASENQNKTLPTYTQRYFSEEMKASGTQ